MKDLQHILFDQIIHYPNLNSTMVKARELIRYREVSGNFLVIADKQRSGTGRQNNRWFSPKGGLWFTAAFYRLNFRSSITLFVGITILKFLQKTAPDHFKDLKLKWPNDIFLKDHKVGGILMQYQENTRYHLLGIGLNNKNNDFPEDLEDVSGWCRLGR